MIVYRVAVYAIAGFTLVVGAAAEQPGSHQAGQAVVAAAEPAQDQPDPDPLPLLVSAEVQLMTKICELSPDQSRILQGEAQTAVRLWHGTAATESLVDKMRPSLALKLEKISPSTFNRFSAERLCIERRERRAACLLNICALDTSLILTSEQRLALQELIPLPEAWGGSARRPFLPLSPSAPPLPDTLSAGGLPNLRISETRLAASIRPTQFAAFKLFHLAEPHETQIASGAGVKQWLIGDQTPLDDQRRRLTALLERFIENACLICRLNEVQRTKSRMAGKLDIERYAERYRSVETKKDNQVANWFRLMMLRVNAFAIFVEHDSNYQKLLRNELDNGQKTSRAVAETERLAFHKRAIVEAVVVGFQRSAALTTDECDRLAGRFNDLLADCRGAIHKRSEWLHSIVEIPEQDIKSAINEENWMAAQAKLAQLREVAKFLEGHESLAP